MIHERMLWGHSAVVVFTSTRRHDLIRGLRTAFNNLQVENITTL